MAERINSSKEVSMQVSTQAHKSSEQMARVSLSSSAPFATSTSGVMAQSTRHIVQHCQLQRGWFLP